jgi:beta-xylosidase
MVMKRNCIRLLVPASQTLFCSILVWTASGLAWGQAVTTKAALVAATYTNPVGDSPVHMGDPLVLQYEGKYYLYGSAGAPPGGFRYFESTDLVHWQARDGKIWQPAGGAPEVRFYQGKFYMTYSASPKGTGGLRMGIAISEKPEGPYRDLYFPWFDEGYGAIDSDLFVDDDGFPYLFFSRNGNMPGFNLGGTLYAVALTKDLKLKDKPKEILTPDQPWEMILEHNHWCLEGPYVFRHAGKYYMTYSANDTFRPGYAVGYAVADKPLGPWVKAKENPILKDTPEAGIAGPGHNSITWSPDHKEMFIAYHSHADPAKITRERVVNIDRLVFDDAGRLKVVGPTSAPKPMPSGVRITR